MTAYARKEEKSNSFSLSIELRSVNHRFLEMSIKMPEPLRMLEMQLRTRIKQRIKRGKLDCIVCFSPQNDKAMLAFNRSLVQNLAKTLHEIEQLVENAAPVNALDILNWPGVISKDTIDYSDADNSDADKSDANKSEQGIIKETFFSLLDRAIDELLESKTREGKALEGMLITRVDGIRKLTALLRKEMPGLLQQQKICLEEKLRAITINVDVDNNRLEQEMVYLAQKADIAEELDRLEVHLDEVMRTLKSNDVIGRRLDFLMQELHREANTLGSKSIAVITTQTSVDMKVLLEQMREQIQNIE